MKVHVVLVRGSRVVYRSQQSSVLSVRIPVLCPFPLPVLTLELDVSTPYLVLQLASSSAGRDRPISLIRRRSVAQSLKRQMEPVR